MVFPPLFWGFFSIPSVCVYLEFYYGEMISLEFHGFFNILISASLLFMDFSCSEDRGGAGMRFFSHFSPSDGFFV